MPDASYKDCGDYNKPVDGDGLPDAGWPGVRRARPGVHAASATASSRPVRSDERRAVRSYAAQSAADPGARGQVPLPGRESGRDDECSGVSGAPGSS
jgi:hypothetical protein